MARFSVPVLFHLALLWLRPVASNAIPAQCIQMPIDHFDEANHATYDNRFWVNDTFYEPGGPVFLYDAGESSVTADTVDYTIGASSDTSAPMMLAQRFNGLALVWEHRYYGESLPFPVNKTSGTPLDGLHAYRYLTTEQALEDIAYLGQHFQPNGLQEHWPVLHASQTPWVFIGGSYPGVRAAWSRLRNPDVIYASWSSSADVEVRVGFPEYAQQVYKAMTTNCSADFAAAIGYFDSALTSGSSEEATLIKTLVSMAGSNTTYHANFTSYDFDADRDAAKDLSNFDAATTLQSFVPGDIQSTGFDEAMLPYCDLMESFGSSASFEGSSLEQIASAAFAEHRKTEKATPKGVAATHGAWSAFVALLHATAKYSRDTWEENEANADPIADNSWNWQCCTEYGYFQVANTSSPYNLYSKFNTVEGSEAAYCTPDFFEVADQDSSALPQRPRTKSGNRYGGWNMQPSNTMFTDGSLDPWFPLTVFSNYTDIGAPARKVTRQIPKAGQAPPQHEVFGLLHEGAYHVPDFFGTPETDAAVGLFSEALKEWLPAFKPKC